MPLTSGARGRRFEQRVAKMLDTLSAKHPGLVEVRVQPEIKLHDGRKVRPDFELVFQADATRHVVIECQSRSRTSTSIIDKIRTMRQLSQHNSFVFVFEDGRRLGREHRRILEKDGVTCFGPPEFEEWLGNIDAVVSALPKKGGSAGGGGGGGGFGSRLAPIMWDRQDRWWDKF